MLPYFIEILHHFYQLHFAPLLLATILNTLPEVLMNVLQFIFSKISTQLSIIQRLPTRYQQFFKKYFFKKNTKKLNGNALKMIQICIYFTKNI